MTKTRVAMHGDLRFTGAMAVMFLVFITVAFLAGLPRIWLH